MPKIYRLYCPINTTILLIITIILLFIIIVTKIVKTDNASFRGFYNDVSLYLGCLQSHVGWWPWLASVVNRTSCHSLMKSAEQTAASRTAPDRDDGRWEWLVSNRRRPDIRANEHMDNGKSWTRACRKTRSWRRLNDSGGRKASDRRQW